jgi:hypothetical protein
MPHHRDAHHFRDWMDRSPFVALGVAATTSLFAGTAWVALMMWWARH